MNNWFKLGDYVAESLKGITPKYVEESDIIVLNQRCIRDNKIDYSFSRFHDSNKKFSESKIVRKGDLLFNSTGQGTAGRCAFVRNLPEGKTVITDSHILILRLKDYYLTECFSYMSFKEELLIQTFMDGSTGQGELDKLRLFNLEFRLPEKTERSIICKFLNDLDAKIEINNKINQELEAMAKLLYDYWFVQFDFPNAEGKPYKTSGGKMVYNEALKREIPEGWEVKSLEEVLTVVRGASPRPINDYLSDTGLPWIKISDATKSDSRFIIKTKEFIKVEGESKTRLLEPDNLILSNSASPAIPRIVKIRSGIHDGWLLIKDFKKSLTKEFMYHYFTYERPRIINLGSGSIFKNLKTDYVKGLKIIIPPENLLMEANQKFIATSEKIFNATKQNQKLAELRDWLLPMLMNGQVTVGNDTEADSNLGMVAEEEMKYGKE